MSKSRSPATPEEQARRKEEAAERKQRERAEFIAALARDLEQARAASLQIEQKLKEAREHAIRYKALVSHLDGFYQEIDKLAKNKGVFLATDLVVETINDIVRDAKRLVAGDPYLDRTKEFVPAGENPAYSDVLLVARAVQQCLQRSEDGILGQEKRLGRELRQAETITAGLSCWIETDDQPTKDEVAERMAGKPVDAWFYDAEDGETYFNYERLKQLGVQKSVSTE